MSTATFAATLGDQADIRYACERCKNEKVLPPPRTTLGRGGGLAAAVMAFGRMVSRRQSFGRSRRQLITEMLAKDDDRARRQFSSSFRFCHECRRFVCSKCWSLSWGGCQSCVTRIVENLSPRRRRVRAGLSMSVIAGSLLLLAIGIGSAMLVGPH